MLVGEVLRSAARRAPGRPAVTCGRRSVSFGELAEAAERVAGALRARRIRRGARVVWWGDPTVDAVALYFATAHLGAAMVPLNPAFSAGEAAPLLDLADPELVVGDDAHPGDTDLTELVAAPRGDPVDGQPGPAGRVAVPPEPARHGGCRRLAAAAIGEADGQGDLAEVFGEPEAVQDRGLPQQTRDH